MRFKAVLLLFALCVLPAVFCCAVTTQKWEINSVTAFGKGRLTNVIVNDSGEVSLWHGRRKLGEFGKEIWTSTVTPDGVLYFGTSTPAAIYRLVLPAAHDFRGELAPKQILRTEGIAFVSMAADAKGTVYVGSLGDGRIYRAQGEEVKQFCQLPALYVWALVPDGRGWLYVGTGPKGKIYRVDANGNAEEWWTLPEPNALSMTLDRDGSLLVGGSERGLLYRVTGKNQGTVVYEFAENEIKALLFSGDGKTLYVAANQKRGKPPREEQKEPQPADTPVAALSRQLQGQVVTGEIPEPSPKVTQAESRAVAQLSGALYAMRESGRVDKLLDLPTEWIHDLALDGQGRLLAATGSGGRIYRITPDVMWESLVDSGGQQLLTIALHKGQFVFFGTGGVGAAWLIDPQRARTGEWMSEVRNCQLASDWGNLEWRASGRLSFSTRSGNTPLPDATWSEWSAPITEPGQKIPSPPARYLQIRAQWDGDDNAVLSSVTAYFLNRNQRPQITSITIDGVAIGGDRKPGKPQEEKPAPPPPPQPQPQQQQQPPTPAAAAAPKRPKPHSTTKRITWKAEDKDGDALEFRLFYQVEGDDVWIPFLLPRPLDKPEYNWDTESVPDGRYRIKVVASDRPSNSPQDALSDEKISDLLVVDNTRPVVTFRKFDATAVRVSGTATDNLSAIQCLEYSVNGGEWQFIGPVDRIFDNLKEDFEFTVGELPPGVHHIAVRATDADGNVGVGSTRVELKK